MAPPRVWIAYTAGGGGHKSVAQALQQHLESVFGWRVGLVNPYRDLGSFVDVLRLLTGQHTEDFYNRLLKHAIPTYVPYQCFHLFASAIRLNRLIYGRRAIQQFASFWRRDPPDLVVSVMPWINDLLAESVRIASPGTPFVTVMTDYDECARGMWISSPLQHLICSSERAVQRAVHRGHPAERILSAPGVVVSPAFYDTPDDQPIPRQQLGLSAGVPTGIVMYGAQGASRMIEIARVMNRAQYPVQLIFICGHDSETADAIRALSTRYRKAVCGFVDDVHRYMAIADFLIGKPGPSSIAESLAKGLPMVLDFDWRTMLQDRYNAMWAIEAGVAKLSRGVRHLPEQVGLLLDQYDRYHKAARSASGRKALYEVAALLERCLPSSQSSLRVHKGLDDEENPGGRESEKAAPEAAFL